MGAAIGRISLSLAGLVVPSLVALMVSLVSQDKYYFNMAMTGFVLLILALIALFAIFKSDQVLLSSMAFVSLGCGVAVSTIQWTKGPSETQPSGDEYYTNFWGDSVKK